MAAYWPGPTTPPGTASGEGDALNQEVLVALIAVVPTTLAVTLGFLASRRSTHQSVAVPLIQALRQLDAKTDRIDSEVRRRLDRLDDGLGRVATGQTDIRERIARLEGQSSAPRERLWAPRSGAL